MSKSKVKAKLQRYLASFGLEQGLKYFEAGVSLEDAAVDFLAKAKKENESLKGQVRALRFGGSSWESHFTGHHEIPKQVVRRSFESLIKVRC